MVSTPTATRTTAAATPASTPSPNEVDHPRTVYVREDEIVCDLDRWLTTVFDPDNLDETCAVLAAASVADDVDEAALEAARRKLEDCDSRLTRYRSALESGADPTIVTQWIAEVQGDRLSAEQCIASSSHSILDVDEVRERIEALGPMGPVLNDRELRNEGGALRRSEPAAYLPTDPGPSSR